MSPIPAKMGPMKPFQLLEINIISAQDLEPVSKKMKTYATAWIHPNRKLTTGLDVEGGNNPTWNDKFVFRVDEEFLRQDTSAVQIEIHCVHWFRDSLVGTVRVLVGNLIPPPTRLHHHHPHLGMRFVALQIRRSSGRPQGILNIGVTLLDGSMRSMALYRQLSMSAVGYRDLMEEEIPFYNKNAHNLINDNDNNNKRITAVNPVLRRSRSERSMMYDNISVANSSLVAIPKTMAHEKESSILSISMEPPIQMLKKKSKASSVINGAELREKPKIKGKKGKSGSVVSDSIVSKESSNHHRPRDNDNKPKLKLIELDIEHMDNNKPTTEKKIGTVSVSPPTTKTVDEKSITKPKGKTSTALVVKPPMPKNYELGGPKGPGHNGKFAFGGPNKANSPWSDSEVGPSPSEVAATMALAERRYPIPMHDERSSVLDGWSIDESVEGLRSKLDRWRTEIPPLYDRGLDSSSFQSTGRHTRRHTDGGSGLFSCFGNIYGYECQCICGQPRKRNVNNRFNNGSEVSSRSWF